MLPTDIVTFFDHFKVGGTFTTHMGNDPVITLVSEHRRIAFKLCVELTKEFDEVFKIEPSEVHGE